MNSDDYHLQSTMCATITGFQRADRPVLPAGDLRWPHVHAARVPRAEAPAAHGQDLRQDAIVMIFGSLGCALLLLRSPRYTEARCILTMIVSLDATL